MKFLVDRCAGRRQRASHTSLATTLRYIEVTPDQERRALRVLKS